MTSKTCPKCSKDSDYWSPIKNNQVCLYCDADIHEKEDKVKEDVCQNCGSHDGSICECWRYEKYNGTFSESRQYEMMY